MIDDDKTIEPKLGDPIPEDWIQQATQEIKSKVRHIVLPEFKDKKDVEICIHQPSTGEDSLCSVIYSRAYSKHIKDKDMLTKPQMKKILEERGMWGEEQEKQIEALRSQKTDIEYEVAKIRSKNKNPNAATISRYRTQWTNINKEIQEKLVEKENYFSNTVEGRAEEEQLKSKLSLCVKYADGTRVWPTMVDFDNETDRNSLVTIMNAAILFWMGLTQEIIDKLPAQIIFGGEETDQKTS